jgi:NTE family protein
MVGTSAGSTSAALLRAGLPPIDYLARLTGQALTPEGEAVLGGVSRLRLPHRRERPARRPAAPGLLPSIARRPWRYRPGVAAAALLPEGTLPVDSSVSGISGLFPDWPDRTTWICTVRLDDGTRVVYGRDAAASMRQAVSASCAIPGYFEPVVIDGSRHVDGGMWSVHNLDLVAGLGLDLVLVSAPMSISDPRAVERGMLARLLVRHRLEHEVATVRRSGSRVLVLQPERALREVMGTRAMSLSRRAPVARAAHAQIQQLARSGRLDGI